MAFAQPQNRALCEMNLYPEDAIPELSAAPRGFKPFYISHYGRHGSRALTNKYASAIAYSHVALSKANNDKALSDQGVRLFCEVDKVYKENKGYMDHLTVKGQMQQRGIAKRMANNFPEVIKKGAKVNVRTSIYSRCIMSMTSFTTSLSSSCSGLNYDFACAPAIQGYLNPRIPGTHKADALREEYYTEIQKHFNSVTFAEGLFLDRNLAAKYVDNCDALVYGLYLMAVNCCNLDLDTDLLSLVPAEVIDYYGTRHNREIYYQACNSADFGGIVIPGLDSLVFSMLERADAAVAGKGADVDLCFGHDFSLAGYEALFELDGVPSGLKGTEIDSAFYSSEIIPMAANLQQVFYHSRHGEILVKFILNEREVRSNVLKPVVGNYYRWEDVRARLVANMAPRSEAGVEPEN